MNAPWLTIAAAEQGVQPHPPGSSNPRITAYHAGTNIAGYDDKVSWCSGANPRKAGRAMSAITCGMSTRMSCCWAATNWVPCGNTGTPWRRYWRSEEHTSELQSH